MISQYPVGPSSLWQSCFVVFHDPSDARRVPSSPEKLKVEGQIRAVQIGSVIGNQLLNGQINLTDQNAIWISIDHTAHLGNDRMNLRPIGGIEGQQPIGRRLTRNVA